MRTVTSADGTRIAFDQQGDGPAVILVDGALCSRGLGPMPELAGALAEHFTVVHYDRRGRGDSTDEAPPGSFESKRELEDLAALVEATGGSASLVGMSSGGALAIEAAGRLAGIDRVIAYEVPYITDPDRTLPADYGPRLRALVADDRRSDAVRLFLRTVGMPGPLVQLMRMTPPFAKLKRVAHTLPYDAELLIEALGPERRLPRDRWATITASVAVVAGAMSPATMRDANADLARVLGAEHRELEGQNHMVKGKAIAPALIDLLRAPAADQA